MHGAGGGAMAVPVRCPFSLRRCSIWNMTSLGTRLRNPTERERLLRYGFGRMGPSAARTNRGPTQAGTSVPIEKRCSTKRDFAFLHRTHSGQVQYCSL